MTAKIGVNVPQGRSNTNQCANVKIKGEGYG